MTDLSDLIARLEAATEGSRELSDEVLVALWVTRDDGWVKPNGDVCEWGDEPNCTESLDDALGLVPEGWGWMVEGRHGKGQATVYLTGDEHWPLLAAATPALALCAAILRAKEADRVRT